MHVHHSLSHLLCVFSLFALPSLLSSPLLYSIVALLQQGKVADSTAGVPMEQQHEVNPLAAFVPQQQQQQGGAQEQTQQQRSQPQSARAAFNADVDAPRPLQFTNRQ